MPNIFVYGLDLYTYSGNPSDLTITQGSNTVGETLQFDGGAGVRLEITDDDAFLEDGYVETGGAQTLTTGVTINGTFYPAGSTVELEFTMLDGSGTPYSVIRINGDNVGILYPDGSPPTSGDVFTITDHRDGAAGDSSDGTSSTLGYGAVMMCFAAGTMIDTPDGERPVETLRMGDPVATLDGGAQPVRWIARTEQRHPADPDKPIEFKPGSLGNGRPARRLVVSPQHRLMMQTRDRTEYLAPAKAFVGQPGVRQMRGVKQVDYWHVFLDPHAIVFADGALTESFYPGRYILSQLDESAFTALMAVCPDFDGFKPARPLLGCAAAMRELEKNAQNTVMV